MLMLIWKPLENYLLDIYPLAAAYKSIEKDALSERGNKIVIVTLARHDAAKPIQYRCENCRKMLINPVQSTLFI